MCVTSSAYCPAVALALKHMVSPIDASMGTSNSVVSASTGSRAACAGGAAGPALTAQADVGTAVETLVNVD